MVKSIEIFEWAVAASWDKLLVYSLVSGFVSFRLNSQESIATYFVGFIAATARQLH